MATKAVITTHAMMQPSVSIDALNSSSLRYWIMCPQVSKVVKDYRNTRTSVKVTVGLTAVFYLTVGIRAMKETISADMLSMVLPVVLFSWQKIPMLMIPSSNKGKQIVNKVGLGILYAGSMKCAYWKLLIELPEDKGCNSSKDCCISFMLRVALGDIFLESFLWVFSSSYSNLLVYSTQSWLSANSYTPKLVSSAKENLVQISAQSMRLNLIMQVIPLIQVFNFLKVKLMMNLTVSKGDQNISPKSCVEMTFLMVKFKSFFYLSSFTVTQRLYQLRITASLLWKAISIDFLRNETTSEFMEEQQIERMNVQFTCPDSVNRSILTRFFTLSLKYAGMQYMTLSVGTFGI